MRMKRLMSILIGIMTIMIIFVIAFSTTLFSWKIKNSTLNVEQYFIAIASLLVAIVALVIALITYFSIESVNAISSMEGNVLDNPNYEMATSYLAKAYNDARTQKDFMKKIMRDLKKFVKKHSATCIEFADSIQFIMDHLIWFAYIEYSDALYKKQKVKLIRYIDRKKKKYNKISNGIQYTLNENVKLMKYVMKYQESTRNLKYESCDIADIRGHMFQNPVSRVVYYDYLGLDYRRQAAMQMREISSCGWEFSFESMFNIMERNYGNEQLEKIRLLLMLAENAFKKAEECAEGNLLWEGYIKYNLARVRVMRYLIKDTTIKNCELLGKLKEVVAVRRQVCFIYCKDNGYLSQKLEGELTYAENLYANVLKLMEKTNIKKCGLD